MAKKFYNNDDIQKMIEHVNNDLKLKDAVRKHFKSDLYALNDVLDDGFVDRFDRYDSDVCEQFIVAYEIETEKKETLDELIEDCINNNVSQDVMIDKINDFNERAIEN